MRRVLRYVHASSTRECFAYLVLSFVLTWLVWVPVLLASRRHEQVGHLLVFGSFGPTVAAILLSYRGAHVPGSKLSSRFVCFSLALLLCWAVLVGHASLWDELLSTTCLAPPPRREFLQTMVGATSGAERTEIVPNTVQHHIRKSQKNKTGHTSSSTLSHLLSRGSN